MNSFYIYKTFGVSNAYDLLVEVIRMALDPYHILWFRMPFVKCYDRDMTYSYTKIDPYTKIPQIYLRRTYDLVHEYLHICFGCLNSREFLNEQLANLSEILEFCFLTIYQDTFSMYII